MTLPGTVRPDSGCRATLLQEIQSLLINWKGPDLTTYGELVLEATFRVHRVRNERTFFLFDKILLITKKRGDHFVYKGHIPVTKLSSLMLPSPRTLAPQLPSGFIGLQCQPTSETVSRVGVLFPLTELSCSLPPVLLTDADRKHQRLPLLHRYPLQAQQAAVQHPGEERPTQGTGELLSTLACDSLFPDCPHALGL